MVLNLHIKYWQLDGHVLLMAAKKGGGVGTDTNSQMHLGNLEIAYASLNKV